MREIERFYEFMRFKKGFSKKTIEIYLSVIKKFLKEGNTIKDVKKFYMKCLENDYSSHHIHNVYYALKYYSEFHKKKFTAKKLKVDIRRRKSLTKKEAIVFLSVINEYRDKCIVLIGLTTGLRPSEILNLNIEDLDLKNQTILVRNTKIYEDRMVFIEDSVKPYLELYLEKRKKYTSKALFISYKTGKRLSLNRLDHLFQKYSKISGVNCTPYMLRHTFATLYIKNGGDIKILKELMGHKDIKTTERYIHENPEMIREGYRKYAPRF